MGRVGPSRKLLVPSTFSSSQIPLQTCSWIQPKTCMSFARNRSAAILDLPAEILTLIAVHLAVDPASQRRQVLRTNQLGNLLRVEARKPGMEFKDLLNLGLTCKYLHSICQPIYQKQVVVTLPSTKHVLSQSQSTLPRDRWPRSSRPRSSCYIYTRTIQTNDLVARDWSGAHNVNWLFISNQAYYQPRYSNLFSGLISSTARLARSFSNLKFLCLSRLNDETILLCLERGVGKNLQALSIALSETDESEAGMRGLAERISRLSTISHLHAIQINDIEPTWVGLVNRAHALKELSLHITNFSPKIIKSLHTQERLRKLEIYGGLRETTVGPLLFILINGRFPATEVFKCGLHFGGINNLHHGDVKQYATALAQFTRLRLFIFNHYNLTGNLAYSDIDPTDSVLKRFYAYSAPYLQHSSSLKELISIDFSDPKSTTGILAEKVDLPSDGLEDLPSRIPDSLTPVMGGISEEANFHLNSTICGAQVPHVDSIFGLGPSEIGRRIAVKMSEIPDVREKIMIPFEHRWATIN